MQGLTEEYVYKLKILIFGGKGVGKSSLVYTYVNNHPPVSHFINEDLNFTRKKQEYLVGNSIYECRLHLWEIANRAIANRAVQADLLKQVAAYIFIYKDEKTLKELKTQIWSQLDFKRIGTQPIYIILNDTGRERPRKIMEDFAEMVPNNNEKIYLNQFSLHDPTAVRNFFQLMLKRIMDLCSTQPLENWVLRDRTNKIVLRDQTRKSNQFQKRYNVCC